MIVSIHQSSYFPWLGLLRKIARADEHIVLTRVQYTRRNFQNRVQILVGKEPTWLTIPLKAAPRETLIRQMQIDTSEVWHYRHLNLLNHYYQRAPHYKEMSRWVESILTNWTLTHSTSLVALNMTILAEIFNKLEIRVRLVSDDVLPDAVFQYQKDDLMREICISREAKAYLSGAGGLEYANRDAWAQNNIALELNKTDDLVYPQMHSPGKFVSGLSVLDALFNIGFEGVAKLL